MSDPLEMVGEASAPVCVDGVCELPPVAETTDSDN